MVQDKFSAVWVSHTSLSDFVKCPRAYYLKNVYKDPATKHKIQVMSPPLALGQAVHEVVESLSVLPTQNRFSESLLVKFENAWKKVSGKKGGFSSIEQEEKYKKRGEEMLRRIMRTPGPLVNMAVKIKQSLPYFWLSDADNIILCGKIDWLEYLPSNDSVHIIDFKTSKAEEDGNSMQLPIYHLLVHHCQHRKVEKASYWYLEWSDELVEKALPDLDTAHEQVLKLAKQVKLARQLQLFKCSAGEDGCFACRPLERVLKNEGEFVGTNEYRTDMYILPFEQKAEEHTSELL